MKGEESPKAFICHASEDKERFVLQFAGKLRKKGVNAWLDEWEMKPGDSLVDRIFEEGIRECDAFIVILSKDAMNLVLIIELCDGGISCHERKKLLQDHHSIRSCFLRSSDFWRYS